MVGNGWFYFPVIITLSLSCRLCPLGTDNRRREQPDLLTRPFSSTDAVYISCACLPSQNITQYSKQYAPSTVTHHVVGGYLIRKARPNHGQQFIPNNSLLESTT
ncbi:hypothetical protein BJX70DRAFT_154716 [Aspergillus crustosus]